VPRLEPAGVHRRQRDVRPEHTAGTGEREQSVEQTPGPRERQQPICGTLERRVVRRERHVDRFSPLRAVEQELLDAAVVLPLVLLEHEAGEKLRQREVVSAELGAVLREGVRADVVGRQQHPPW
jgi:hypothetical protein